MSDMTLYWNRRVGVWVNKNTGQSVPVPVFPGSVNEWYETLNETIIDLRNQLRQNAGNDPREINVYVSHDIRRILESTLLFKSQQEKDQSGCIGTLCNMNFFESKKNKRLEVVMEFKTSANTERGKVVILED